MVLYIIIFLLALFVLKAIYNILRAVILRIALYSRLSGICKKRGYELEKPRAIFASFFGYSKKPDIIIRTGETDYLVRIITCRARKRHYHFVSHEWFVRVFRYYILSLAFHSGTPLTLFKTAKYLPPLNEKYLAPDGKNKRVILLFNPSPLEITFTSKSNRREIGSNGTDFDGWTIYNGKAFAQAIGE